MINMTASDAVKSKGMLGGAFLAAVGLYLIYKGNMDLGMIAIGNGLGIMGIRDAK